MATHLTATFAAATLLVFATVTPAHAAASSVFTCTYTFVPWPGGFEANLSIANSGPTIDGWIAHWTFATPTQATGSWSARLTQADPVDVVATPMAWDSVILAGASAAFGWTALATSTAAPTDVTVNGKRC